MKGKPCCLPGLWIVATLVSCAQANSEAGGEMVNAGNPAGGDHGSHGRDGERGNVWRHHELYIRRALTAPAA